MKAISAENLMHAVDVVSADIQGAIQIGVRPAERQLWWELTCCLLSSQVPYDLAVAVTNVVDREGLLYMGAIDASNLVMELLSALSTPVEVNGKMRLYRFPKCRAHQLAETYGKIRSEHSSLQGLLDSFPDPSILRTWFVENAPGLGPKQASMFLRNIGVSYDLAVLDRHVLNYMFRIGVHGEPETKVHKLKHYVLHEEKLRDHADRFQCPVGIMDWAIWIVMRVANQISEDA